jgi:lipopolysaccharide transport system ATP-binding protein
MGSITVSNLGKAYKQYPHRWSRLLEWIVPGGEPRHQLKWVLQDINFTVQPGEAVGVIGINGAGKSTLLKMITGTTQPTTGSVVIRGRVAALLELGIGFHPDFTGRQNAYMAGQLLGYTVEEIAALLPEIEAFAEVGAYIDLPVRVYSSGMQMRLAFSVATASRPDVLIVDEALSVGDAYFQQKSFNRIREFRKLGTTLLIVSHDKNAIQSICDRAILINSGNFEMDGVPETVFDYYTALLVGGSRHEISQKKINNKKTVTESGGLEAIIDDVWIQERSGRKLLTIGVGHEIQVHIHVKVKKDIRSLVLGCGFKDRLGQLVFGTNTSYTNQELNNVSAGSEFIFVFECVAALGVGSYSTTVAIQAANPVCDGKYHWIDNNIIFDVVNYDKDQFAGVAWTEMKFMINTIK